MSKKWPGGIITPTPATPTGPYQDGAAPGIWTLSQQAYWARQNLWPIAGNKEIGWATYWDTQNLNWDGGQYVGGGLALTSNGNAFASYGFSFSTFFATALYGCNTTTGVPSFIGYTGNSTNSHPSFSQPGCITYNGNSIAVGSFLGSSNSSSNSAPYTSVVSMATPSSPSVTFGRYQGAISGTNGDQFGFTTDGSNIYTAYDSSEANAVTKYNSSGVVQWSYGATSNRTYFQLGVNASYDAANGYAGEVIDSIDYGVRKFDLSTGASVWAVSISPTGSSYFNDPFYTSRVCVSSDGGVIVTAGSSLTGNVMVVKLSSAGALVWAKQLNSAGLPNQIVSAGGFVYVMTRFSSGSQNGKVYKINESTGAGDFRLDFSGSGSGRVFPVGLTVDPANNAIYVALTSRPTGVYYRTWMWRLPLSGRYTPVTVADVSVSSTAFNTTNLGSATVGTNLLSWNSLSITSTSGGNSYTSSSPSNSTTVF